MLIPSTPDAPLFAFTLLKALFRLSLSSIFAKRSGCALSLSFHIRLNERCALTYPLCSALPLCEQPSFLAFPASMRAFLLSRSYYGLLLIRPFTSLLLWSLLTSARSAMSLNNGCPFLDIPRKPPRVPHVSFPPSTCHIYPA